MNDPRRGEIWLVNFDPQVGDEIRKTRPALVVSASQHTRLDLRIIVPFTDWKDSYEHHYTKVRVLPNRTNGLTKDSAVDAFPIRCISVQRFLRDNPTGRLTISEMNDVCIAIRIATGMNA
ncbi:MAG: type II toxin-antitoxin system PemK/MazF family toxin [Verrucomicrobia bacterium]|nr:type II toxin-antitoxin system PemK/MazF family toxin [Verrucomicrobiota bacterium]